MINSESIQPLNINKRTNYHKPSQGPSNDPSFKGRKIAVAKPIVDGIAKEIEIYSVGKKDAGVIQAAIEKLNLRELLPNHANHPNFNVWEGLLNLAAEDIGQFSKQRTYLAVADKKPCGIITANSSKSEGTLGILASIPVAVNEKVKGAGSSLMTAFLDMAKGKKLKKVKLEPIINGPTDAVSFYERHNFKFTDPYASTMQATRFDINKTLEQNIQDLNYKKLRNQPEINLGNYLDA